METFLKNLWEKNLVIHEDDGNFDDCICIEKEIFPYRKDSENESQSHFNCWLTNESGPIIGSQIAITHANPEKAIFVMLAIRGFSIDFDMVTGCILETYNDRKSITFDYYGIIGNPKRCILSGEKVPIRFFLKFSKTQTGFVLPEITDDQKSKIDIGSILEKIIKNS